MNPLEEELYEVAGQEIASQSVNRGIWAKAFSDALGDEPKTKAIYIALRVAQLREQLTSEIARQKEADSKRRLREDTAIREQFALLRRLPFKDTDHISAESFDGSPEQLCYPLPVSRVCDATDLLEFMVIDLIKHRHIKGVRHRGEWFFDLDPNA